MLKFFTPLSAADATSQQQQQHAASAAVTIARASVTAAMRRGPGRPKKVLSVNSALAAPADSEDVEQPAKRCKYENWSERAAVHACCSISCHG
jgi:hypothetical protein